METRQERMFVGNCVPAQSLDEFIRFWAWLYPDREEPEYTENIGHVLTADSILTLFKWKFPRFAKDNKDRLEHDLQNAFAHWHEDMKPEDFLHQDFQTLGPIWRLFWLHCRCPRRFPIFDQHVHRAMVFIENGSDPQTIKLDFKSEEVLRIYRTKYLTFHCRFHGIKTRGPFDREIDRALYMFGQTLARKRWNFGNDS